MKIVATNCRGVHTYTVRVDYESDGEWFERIVAGPFDTRAEAEEFIAGRGK